MERGVREVVVLKLLGSEGGRGSVGGGGIVMRLNIIKEGWGDYLGGDKVLWMDRLEFEGMKEGLEGGIMVGGRFWGDSWREIMGVELGVIMW